MDAALTGKAGKDALRVYADLGATDARFDGRKVASAILTAKGRSRLLRMHVSTRMQRVVRMLVPRPRARRHRIRVRSARTTRSARRSASGRPEPHGEPSRRHSAPEGAAGGTFRRGA